jgi:hypothetical protein
MSFSVPLADGQLHNVSNLFLNLDEIATEAYYNKQLKENSLATVKRRVFETLNHELGHAVAISNLKKAYDTSRNKLASPNDRLDAYKTIAWMDREYGTWLKHMEQSPQIEYLNTGTSPSRAIHMGGLGSAVTGPNGETVPAGEVMQGRSMQEDFPIGTSGKDPQQLKNYLLSFDEFWAEMTARMATQGQLATGFDGTTPVDPVITKFFKPVLAQYKKMFEQMPQFAKNEYANNWETFIKSQMIGKKLDQMTEDAAGAGGKDIVDALNGKLPGFDPKNFAGVKEYRDKFSKIMKSGFTILQIAQENPHIIHLQNYIKGLNTWQSYQRDKQVSIVDTLNDWKGLGRAEASILSRTLLEESETGKRYDLKELASKLNGESLLVYQKVRGELDKVLDEMRQVSILDATRNFYDNSEKLKTEIDAINTEFDKMGSKGYFPFMRFGKFTMKVKALEDLELGGESYKKGQLISFPAFESEKERDTVYTNTKKMLGSKAAVTASTFSDENSVLQGIPTSLLRTLKSKLENSGALSNEQSKAIDEAIESVSPSGKFLKHFRKRQGIHGYSEDSMRSFAMYSRNATGHLAKVKYADMLREPIAGMKEDVKIIGSYGGYAQSRQQMTDWMDRHFNYVMQPANELAALRSAGFVAALGFNIKSAAVNATQPFTTTLPYLSARYGDINAIKHMGMAMNTLKDWVLNKKAYIDAMPGEDGKVVKPDDKRGRTGDLITKLLHEGQIDQSLATELSIAASENNLDRGLYMPSYRRFWHETSRYSALPFHVVEKMNRYITSIAAYNADYEKFGDHSKAINAARQANWSSNFENARWNRPEFMRGKKSAALLFASYTQNTLYFATHDKGAVRWWLGMMLLGGLMGLPFAKNLEDLVDAAMTEVNSLLGVRDPKNSLRVEMRKHLEDLHANPDLILHGLSQDSFGLGQLGELTGIPIPHFDMSSSIGMGQILPGTQIPSLIQNGGDANKVFRQGVVEAAGAGGNLVDQFYSGLMSNNPDTWKKVESMLPMMSARSVSKALRMGTRGKEQMADGTLVADFDMSDLRDQLTIVGQGLGFTPSKVTAGYEKEITKKDMVQYYKTHQAALLQQHNWAILNEDRESVADVRKKILDYNSNVPYPEMGITAKTLKDSAKTYIKKQIINGAGITADRKYNRLQKYVEEAYPNPLPDKLDKE